MYDPFNERTKPEDLASDNRARTLMNYLATRKEPQNDHAKTVMAFVTQKAAADHRIRSLEMELERYRNTEAAMRDPRAEVDMPKTMLLPAGARSVEVKF